MILDRSAPDDEALSSPTPDIEKLRRVVRVLGTALQHDSAISLLGGRGLFHALSSSTIEGEVSGSKKVVNVYFSGQRQLLLLEAAEAKTRMAEEILDDFANLINEVYYTIIETRTVLEEEASLLEILSLPNQDSADYSESSIMSDTLTSGMENGLYSKIPLNEELFGSTAITLDMLDGLGEYLSRRDYEETADEKRKEMKYIRHIHRNRLIRSFTKSAGRHKDIVAQFVMGTGDDLYNRSVIPSNSGAEGSFTIKQYIQDPRAHRNSEKVSQPESSPTNRYPVYCRSELIDVKTNDPLHVYPLEWRPSIIATRSTDGPVADPNFPKRIQMTLIVSIMKKPKGITEKSTAMSEQGYYCKQCLHMLRKSPNPIRGWDAAVFCNYTGFYFCEECNDRSTFAIIPARVVRQWNFKKHMVSRLAHDFLETHMYSPIMCISAINPDLYGQIWILETVRRLRAELMSLHGIGKQCKRFCNAFYSTTTTDSFDIIERYKRSSSLFDTASEIFRQASVCGSEGYRGQDTLYRSHRDFSRASQVSYIFDDVESHADGNISDDNQPNAFCDEEQNFIPESKRYLCMDCECWSMDNLQELHAADPDNIGAAFIEQWREKKHDEYVASRNAKRLSQQKHDHVLTPYAHLSPLITFLLLVRKLFLRHIVQECVDLCLRKAAHICYHCKLKEGKDLIFTFDTTRRGMPSFHVCSTCGTVYHAWCWRDMERKATNMAQKWQGKCNSHHLGDDIIAEGRENIMKERKSHMKSCVVGVVCHKCANETLKSKSVQLIVEGEGQYI